MSSARQCAELERNMDNEELLELYQYRIFKKLKIMWQAERAAYMADLFGRHWMKVYEHLANLYPQLLSAPNAGVQEVRHD